MSIYTFAFSLVNIFVPIYLYNLGFSLRDIFIYYIQVFFFLSFTVALAGWLVSRFGAKHIIGISLPLTSLSFVLLLTLGNYHWPIWLVTFIYALAIGLYWVGYHDDFSKAKNKKSAGRQMGRMSVLTALAGAFAPLIGGIVGQSLGLPFVMGITAFLLLIAFTPLLKTSEITTRRPIEKGNFQIRKNIKDIIAYGGLGVETTSSGIIWPLFIFLLLGNFVRVGSITTISLTLMIAASIFVGRLTDKYEKRKVLRAGSVVNFLGCSARGLVSSLSLAYILNAFTSVAFVFINIPFMSEYYLRADEEPRIEYLISMEVGINVMRTLGFVILLIATYFFEIKMVLVLGFILGAIGVLLSNNMGKNQKKSYKNLKLHKEIAGVRS